MFIKGCIFWVVNKLPSLFSLFHYCYYYYYYWKLGNESDYFAIWQGLHFKFQNCFLLCLVLNKMHLEYDLEFKLYWSCKSWAKKYLYHYPSVCKSSTGFTFSSVQGCVRVSALGDAYAEMSLSVATLFKTNKPQKQKGGPKLAPQSHW